MVSMLDSGVSSPGLSSGWGHCVLFLGKTCTSTLYSHSASLQVKASEISQSLRVMSFK